MTPRPVMTREELHRLVWAKSLGIQRWTSRCRQPA